MENSDPTFKRSFCNGCTKLTRHEIHASIVDVHEELVEGYPMQWGRTDEILECCGCGHVQFFSRRWDSAHDGPDGEPLYEDTYYPPQVPRAIPEWIDGLTIDIEQVLDEVYRAYQHDLRYLTAVGIRTAIDMAIVDKIGDQGTFPQKIAALQNAGTITQEDRELIESLTETGNAAAHRGYAPSKSTLDSALRIMEAVIYRLYLQEVQQQQLLQAAKTLKNLAPKRQK